MEAGLVIRLAESSFFFPFQLIFNLLLKTRGNISLISTHLRLKKGKIRPPHKHNQPTRKPSTALTPRRLKRAMSSVP
jgi:hypothetical protein